MRARSPSKREPTQCQQHLTDAPKAFVTFASAPTVTHASADSILLTTGGQKAQCYERKGSGHLARNCKNKSFCNYCKQTRHVISECRTYLLKRMSRLNPATIQGKQHFRLILIP